MSPHLFGFDVDEELPFLPPLFPDNLFGHLAATGVPGVEEWRDGAYRAALRLPHGPGIVALRPPASRASAPSSARASAAARPFVRARLLLSDRRDLPAAVARCRFLLDLDTDPVAVDAALSADPVLAPLVAAAPGRRVPRSGDPEEFAVRAVLGQQVSTAAARTHAARLVLAHGDPVTDPEGGLTHLFPTVDSLAGLDPEALAMPRTRKATLIGLIEALRSGAVKLPAGFAEAREQLAALPGFGPWTVETVLMRALGDPDAFIQGDLGVRIAAERLGLPDRPAPLTRRAEAWRPYRAYAVQHLWATGEHAVNSLPA